MTTTAAISHSTSSIIIFFGRLSRSRPELTDLRRGFRVKWEPSRLAPPPAPTKPDDEPDEPEPRYPYWTWFIKNPRPGCNSPPLS